MDQARVAKKETFTEAIAYQTGSVIVNFARTTAPLFARPRTKPAQYGEAIATLLLPLALMMFATLSGAAELGLAAKGPLEKQPLFAPEQLKAWYGAESTAEASTAHVKDAAHALHWHVTVDYHAGEPKYPVGWPRLGRSLDGPTLPEPSGWDYLHGWVYTETSRSQLPRVAAGLSLKLAGGRGDDQRVLSELKKGAWVELLWPISQLTQSQTLERVQFHISESNYQHGDTFDLYLSDLALLRFTSPTLLSFAPESAVMFTDVAHLPVMAQVAGLKMGASCDFTCELRRGPETVVRLATQAVRGVQRLSLDLGKNNLEPGNYELLAKVAGNPQPATAKLRLVESPWK